MVTGQVTVGSSPVVSVSQLLDHLDERLEEASDAVEALSGSARLFAEGMVQSIEDLKAILEGAALEALDNHDEL